MVIFVRLQHIGRLNGNISAHRLSHGFCTVFGGNLYFGDSDIRLLVIVLLKPDPIFRCSCFLENVSFRPDTDDQCKHTHIIVEEKVIEAAASKGVYHKNNASRKVSRLATAVSKMA